MDIDQISQLVNQNATNGTNSTVNNKTDKDQAFTFVLEQMIKSMEDESAKSSSDGSNSDTLIGGSNYTSQMLQVMLEAIKQNANKSSNQNTSNTSTLNNTPITNSISGLNYAGSTSSSLTVNNIDSQINSDIDAASKKYNVEKPLIEAVIQQESSFNPSAVSGSGAQGLMQLMPDTARSLGVTNSFNANQNIDGGTKYLKTLLDNFNGNKSLALSAYNGGIGTMQNLNVKSVSDISKMPSETSDYVKKVISYYEKYKTV
jgi:soluble lytic murein transglycosylase-like protein